MRYGRDPVRTCGSLILLEQLEERIVLDGAALLEGTQETEGVTPGSGIFDGQWHEIDGEWFIYWGDAGYWGFDDGTGWNINFAFVYAEEQWYAHDGSTWSDFATTGDFKDFAEGGICPFDGDTHKVDTRPATWYLYWSDRGWWWFDGVYRFAYSYSDDVHGIGQWYEFSGGRWNLFDDPGSSSIFTYNGEWYLLDEDTFYQYNYKTGAGWYYSSGEWTYWGQYRAGEWYEFNGSAWVLTDYDSVDYIGDSQYLISSTRYWDLSSYGLGSDTDLVCSIRDTSADTTILDWYIFTPGSDGYWSGGDLQIAVVDNADFFEAVEQYAIEDVIVVEYNLSGYGNRATLDDVVDGLGVLSDAYDRDIADVAVFSHGSTGGFYIGDWVSTFNYTSHQSSFAEWGSYLTDDAQIMLYHCQVGAASTMLGAIAGWTGADVFANIGDQWFTWWWLDDAYTKNSSIWNHNYYDTFLGRYEQFEDYNFEYQSNPWLGPTGYHMLFAFEGSPWS